MAGNCPSRLLRDDSVAVRSRVAPGQRVRLRAEITRSFGGRIPSFRLRQHRAQVDEVERVHFLEAARRGVVLRRLAACRRRVDKAARTLHVSDDRLDVREGDETLRG